MTKEPITLAQIARTLQQQHNSTCNVVVLTDRLGARVESLETKVSTLLKMVERLGGLLQQYVDIHEKH
jgi:hypothetical protein